MFLAEIPAAPASLTAPWKADYLGHVPFFWVSLDFSQAETFREG